MEMIALLNHQMGVLPLRSKTLL